MSGMEIPIIIATLASAYTTHEGAKKQKESADAQLNMAQEQQKKKEKQFKDQQMQAEADSTRQSQLARVRAMQSARGAFGRSDTILTGPLGLPGGGEQGQKKTLLGV